MFPTGLTNTTNTFEVAVCLRSSNDNVGARSVGVVRQALSPSVGRTFLHEGRRLPRNARMPTTQAHKKSPLKKFYLFVDDSPLVDQRSEFGSPTLRSPN